MVQYIRRPLSNSYNVSETPIMPLFRLEEAPNILMAYRPSSDFRLHSVYYFSLHSQRLLPSPLSASKLQGLPVIHLMDSQIPRFIQHIPPSHSLVLTYLAFAGSLLLILRICNVRIECSLFLSRSPIICATLRILCCFGVDTLSVLAVFSWESGKRRLGEWTECSN